MSFVAGFGDRNENLPVLNLRDSVYYLVFTRSLFCTPYPSWARHFKTEVALKSNFNFTFQYLKNLQLFWKCSLCACAAFTSNTPDS